WCSLPPNGAENAGLGTGDRQRGRHRARGRDAGLGGAQYLMYRPPLWPQTSPPEENASAASTGSGEGGGGDLMRLTRAVTPIRLCDINHAKIATLDALAAEYLRLCQQYTTSFCTEGAPDGYRAP